MTRDSFLAALRNGLSGMSPSAIDDVMADYRGHFDEGAANGRSEAEISAALGDPTRLAKELRAEAGMKRWEEKRSPGNAAAAVFAVLGLGAVDIIILLPILMTIVGLIIGGVFLTIGVFVGGSVLLTAGPFMSPPGGPLAAVLLGLGMIAGATANGAFLILVSVGLVNAIVWFARLHYQMLKPAIEP